MLIITNCIGLLMWFFDGTSWREVCFWWNLYGSDCHGSLFLQTQPKPEGSDA